VKLGEAVVGYLAGLSPMQRGAYQQELNRFVRWFGWERSLSTLTIPEIVNYAERVAPSSADLSRLEPVKAFLIFAKKQGFVSINLAAHLKLRKIEAKLSSTKESPTPLLLTPEGLKELQEELKALEEEHYRIIEEVKRARADGDLSENAPYQMAREQQRRVEARIEELRSLLQRAAAKPEAKEPCRIGIGHKVTLRDLASNEVVSYSLVHPEEANPAKGKISIASPLGKSLMGKGEGEVVEVVIPKGKLDYKIERVEAP